MTSLIAKLWNRLHAKQAPVSIMFIGLDNAGKTSILESLTTSQWFQGGTHSSSRSAESKSKSTSPQTPKGSQTGQSDDKRTRTKSEDGGESPTISINNDLPQSFNRQSDNSPDTGGLLVASRQERMITSDNKVKPTVGYNYERINYRGQSLNVLDFSGQSKYRALWQEFLNCIDGIVFVIDSSDLIRLVVVRDELETLLSNPYFSILQPAVSGGADQQASRQADVATMATGQQLQQKQVTISQGKLILTPLDGAASGASAKPQVASTSSLSSLSTNYNNHINQASRSSGGGTGARGPRRRTKVPILLLANKTDLSNSADTGVITRALNLNQLVNKNRHPWLIQATSVNTNQGLLEGLNWLMGEINNQT